MIVKRAPFSTSICRLSFSIENSDRKSSQKCTSIIFSGTIVAKAEMYNIPTQSNFIAVHPLVADFEGEFMFFYSCLTSLLKDEQVKIILLLSYIVENKIEYHNNV